MGHRLLHQSHTAGGVGPLPARGPDRDARARGKKIAQSAPTLRGGGPDRRGRFAILTSLARYPSGPRERSAKPPFVGSNPTRASRLLFVPLSRSAHPDNRFKLNRFRRIVPQRALAPLPKSPSSRRNHFLSVS